MTDDNNSVPPEPASRTDSNLASLEVAEASTLQRQPANVKSIEQSTNLGCKIGASILYRYGKLRGHRVFYTNDQSARVRFE
jgi:hypothetical protein